MLRSERSNYQLLSGTMKQQTIWTAVNAILLLSFLNFSNNLNAQEIEVSEEFLRSIENNNAAYISTLNSKWSDEITAFFIVNEHIESCAQNNDLCGEAYWNNAVYSNLTACNISTLQNSISEKNYEDVLVGRIYYGAEIPEEYSKIANDVGQACIGWLESDDVVIGEISTTESPELTITGMHYILGAQLGASIELVKNTRSFNKYSYALFHATAVCIVDKIKSNDDFVYLTQFARTDQSKFSEDSEVFQSLLAQLNANLQIDGCMNADIVYENIVREYFLPRWEKTFCDLSMSDREKEANPLRAAAAALNSVTHLQEAENFRDGMINEEYLSEMFAVQTCDGDLFTRNL